ncbi:MAG: DUF779 domain-containing protein [Bacteroidota bacterium]
MTVPSTTNITTKAKQLIDQLRNQHGELMFYQSGGCCDGSAPMCLPKGELIIGENDIRLGIVHGCEFYMSKFQFEYWKQTQITLDVVAGRGSSFSLEIPSGLRFITKSRLFTEEESKALQILEN